MDPATSAVVAPAEAGATAESLAALSSVLDAVGGVEFELEPVLQEIAERAADLCRADHGYVYLKRDGTFRLVSATGGTAEFREYEREHPPPPGRGTVVGRVILERRVVHIPDVLADPEYQWAEGQRMAGYRSLIGVPIEGAGELIGVIGLSRSQVDPFTKEQIATVTVFASQTGVALRIAGLLAETHESLERERAIGNVLQTMGRSSFDLQHVLDTVVANAMTLSHADVGEIVRYDHDHGDYRLAASAGFTPDFAELESRMTYGPERHSLTGRTLHERRPVQIVDVLADPEYGLWQPDNPRPHRTLLGVPMLRDGFPIGVVAVARTEVRAFSEREIALLSTFADQAVLAIENTRLFETVERQRTELARFAPQVASLLSSQEGEQLLAGHRRQITALFCDLRGFTAFAETAEPEEVLGLLRQYHAFVGEVVVSHGGTVEHFAGDGLMVFFNDPTPVPDHRRVAVRAALSMQEGFKPLTAEWLRQGYELGLGIGIGVGYATLGRIGFEGRYDYGAVGNVVILASRLSEAAGAGEILVSQRLFAAIEETFDAEPVPELTLKGFSRPVSAYRIIGTKASPLV